MIRKVFYEVDAHIWPKCQGEMKVITFITDYPVVDRIINHLKLIFAAAKPPLPHIVYQEVLMAIKVAAEYSSLISSLPAEGDVCANSRFFSSSGPS